MAQQEIRESETPEELPPAHDYTPEARRREARLKARLGRVRQELGPGTRFAVVLKRVFLGAWNDGFIHAGNLAYMAMLAIFPFAFLVLFIFPGGLFGKETHERV